LRPALLPARIAQIYAQPAAALAGLALLAILVRAPFNLNTGSDEAFYMIVGRQWLNGLPPYAGSFDVKPPLLFLLMAGAEAIFGPTLVASKVLMNAASVLTVCGLYLFGLRYMGALAGAAAAVLYIFASPTLGSTFATAESFMAPFTTFAMLTGFAALLSRSRLPVAALLASGLLMGAAACVKQTAVFEAVPLALGFLLYRPRGVRVASAATFAAACCAVPLAFALYYLAIGHLGELINDVVLTALLRAGTGYRPWLGTFGITMAGIATFLPILVMAGIFWVERRVLRGTPVYPPLLFLAAWAGAATLSILFNRDLSIVYSLPLLQPLCLAAGGFIQHVLGRIEFPVRRGLLRAVALASAVLYSCNLASAVFLAGGSEVHAAEAAAALMRREGLRPEDRILVVDRDLLVHITSGAEPPHAVFHPLHLLCTFPTREAASALTESMDSKPAFIVMANPPVSLFCEEPGRREAVKARLAKDYCELGRFDSSVTAWAGTFTVFGLKERLGAVSRERCGKRYSQKKADAGK
jgi:4-amino-4-deoxy-L-arabinose transferase-like glycosyltransferase